MIILHPHVSAPHGTSLTRQGEQGRPALRVAADTSVIDVVEAQRAGGGDTDARCLVAVVHAAEKNIGIPARAPGGGIL